jgi:long-chain acyl-CoA synthetase
MSEAQHSFENLVEMFESSVSSFADRDLFGVKKDGQYQWTTYREVGDAVDDFRAGLASLGVGAGDKVAIIANNSPQWAVSAYATYGLGAQFVPMYEAQLEKDWKYILKDSGAKVLLVSTDDIYDSTLGFTDELDALEHVVHLGGTTDDQASYGGLKAIGAASPLPSIQPDPGDICGFIYTSGTTGEPKGVLLSHSNIVSNVNAIHTFFPMDSEDVSLSFLPWAHSFGQTVELHCLISYGAGVGLAVSVATIIENLPEVRPTLLFSVPRIFNKIYGGVQKKMNAAGGLKLKLFKATMATANKKRELAERGSSSPLVDIKHALLDKLVASKVRAAFGGRLRYAFSGGAALSKEVGLFVDNLGIKVYEGYGLTETSPIVSANRPGAQKIGSIGQCIPDVRVEIVPGESLPEGQGEIVVYGPNIMQGYHNLPEKTAEVMTEDGGFRTGDMGRMDEEGYLWITGRVKEQYKLENGKYVAPAPLEEQLKLSPMINQVMIDGANRLYNVALIVPDIDSLKAWAKESGLAYDSDASLCADARAHARIGEELEKFGAPFKGYERPRKWALTSDEFSTENDMLTPTLKLKRRNVMTAYVDTINGLYD